MHEKIIREALTFFGPLTVEQIKEKLSLRGVELNEAYISSVVKKMNAKHSVIISQALDGSTLVKI